MVVWLLRVVVATLFVLAIAARLTDSTALLTATAISWAIALGAAFVVLIVAMVGKRKVVG